MDDPSWFELKNVEHVYIRGDELVITGSPNKGDELHNCDEVGCRHQCVLLRGYFEEKRINAILDSTNSMNPKKHLQSGR